MRPAVRLLASVKAQFLESGAPTGLTGLLTHPTPRGTLSYLYNSTLDRLKHIPDSSVYRQSTEALIKHRLSIIDSIRPEGYDAWHERAQKQVKEQTGATGSDVNVTLAGNAYYAARHEPKGGDVAEESEDSGINEAPLEGTRTEEERARHWERLQKELQHRSSGQMEVEPEPPLSREQIEELENKIGAGLIEEVIQVAAGEHMLVNRMVEARVWEELEEKPQPGQWDYHERNTHTSTQGR
ncbi:MAG: hypothetical protein M1822_005090 [Bathelium mastoideum]|nr:MAG: hypothetical protein M1822_005090 [Bathelium mastoideum]